MAAILGLNIWGKLLIEMKAYVTFRVTTLDDVQKGDPMGACRDDLLILQLTKG